VLFVVLFAAVFCNLSYCVSQHTVIFFHQHPFYSIKEYFELGNSIRGSSNTWISWLVFVFWIVLHHDQVIFRFNFLCKCYNGFSFPNLGYWKKKTNLSSVECMACNTSNLMTCLLSLLIIYICVYLQQYFYCWVYCYFNLHCLDLWLWHFPYLVYKINGNKYIDWLID